MDLRQKHLMFDEARLMVNMAPQKQTVAAFEAFGALVNVTAAKITPLNDSEAYRKSVLEREKK